MKRLLAPIMLVLLATGCGSPASSSAPATDAGSVEATAEATPTPVVMGPGEYTFESLAGAKGTISLPGKPDAEIEKLRGLAKGPATTYVTVKVDNRQGTADVNMYGISVFTPAGEELEYKGVSEYINDITPSDVNSATYNQFIAGYNKHNDTADPKSVKEFVMVGPKVPDVITSVKVYPSGMSDPVDALPAP